MGNNQLKNINVDVFKSVRNKIPTRDIFFLDQLINSMYKNTPYKGLKIFYNAHLTLSSMLQIEALIASGADVTITSTKYLKVDQLVVDLLIKANLPMRYCEDIKEKYECDVVLDCCAGLIDIATPKYGVVELTQTGIIKYQEKRQQYSIISIDDSSIKLLETLIGTSDGFLRGFHKLTNAGLHNKPCVVFGNGKVGKGIVNTLSRFTQNISIIEYNFNNNITDTDKFPIYDIELNKKEINKCLKNAFCVITATGKKGIVSKYIDKKNFNDQQYLINMGSEDEWGDKFLDSEILNNKLAINFCLEFPTKLIFLDPIFYSQIIAIDSLLKSKKIIYSTLDEKIQLDIFIKWCEQQYASYNNNNLEVFKGIFENVPNFIYWKDRDCIYQGCNVNFAKAAGFNTPEDIIGKTDYELPWHDTEADKYFHDDKLALSGATKLNFEETQLQSDHCKKTVLASKIPFYDKSNSIIGVLGIFTDITDRKEKERLELENQTQQIIASEQEKFKEIVGQMAHDIQSPLASLQNIIKHTNNIPELEKLSLRSIVASISNIANILLQQYMGYQIEIQTHEILVFVTLEQLMNETRFQYHNLNIQFIFQNNLTDLFAFTSLDVHDFKSMISNMINNAVDAVIAQDNSIITIILENTEQNIIISVKDNGIGMRKELIENILKCNYNHTTRKKFKNHGMGFIQIQKTLQNCNGTINIESEMHYGSTIIIKIPKIKIPHWFVKEITLGTYDIIIILDHEDSIHYVWDNKLKNIIGKHSTIQIMHFRTAQMAINYLNNINDDKDKILLLIDYELTSDCTGLQIINQFSLAKQSIVVTSNYYTDHIIQEVSKFNIPILPKQIVSDIGININLNKTYNKKNTEHTRIDLILVEPDIATCNAVINIFVDKKIDIYHSSKDLLCNINKYAKKVKICFNYNLIDHNAFELAVILHDLGYFKLTLLTELNLSDCDKPNYLNYINQYDFESLNKYLAEK